MRPTLRRPSPAPWIVAALAVAALGTFVALWLLPRRAEPPAAPPAAPAAPATEPGSPVAPPDPARVRSLLEAVSASAPFRRCLAEEDPLRRAALVIDNLAEGVSPARPLACLAPAGPFAVERQGRRTVVSEATWRRYDDAAAAVASLDAEALARAYRELKPALEGVYRALGYPRASLDVVVARALHRIGDVPVPQGAVEVVEGKGALWAFADPRLEALGPAEKHLLRMGPANARRVQEKARELERALGLAPAPPPAR
jgi:hypothetical protein